MQINIKNNLNSLDLKERLNGNPLFFHSFRGFKTTNTKTSATIYAVHAAMTVIALLVILYSYFVVISIFNIIDKKVSITNINNLNQSIAKSESLYTKKISSINKDTIASMGFVKADKNFFVERVDPAATMSFLFDR